MSQLRTDLWCAGYVRRQNDTGHMCVVARKGDPVAGQIWIEVDHLDGSVSLLAPAPYVARPEDAADRVFQVRLDKTESAQVAERLRREAEFDPDFWVIHLAMRRGELGVLLAAELDR